MDYVTSTHAQKNFGSLMRNLAQKPVFISQHGEARAVLVDITTYSRMAHGGEQLTPQEIRRYHAAKADLKNWKNISTLEELEAKYV